MTNYADCNGSGFEGVDLELLSHKNNIKVYKVSLKYGAATIIGCEKKGKNIQELTKSYQSKNNETVIFLLEDNTELVLSK